MSTLKPNHLYKVSYLTNKDKGQLKVKFSPDLKVADLEDAQIHTNSVLSGTRIALNILLGGIPVMRPATDEEVEAKVYIFKDEKADNELYKVRKQTYESLANTFDGILKELFPDIDYIQSTIKHQQELVFDMNTDQAEEHKYMLEQIAKRVRETPEEEPRTDFDFKDIDPEDVDHWDKDKSTPVEEDEVKDE